MRRIGRLLRVVPFFLHVRHEYLQAENLFESNSTSSRTVYIPMI